MSGRTGTWMPRPHRSKRRTSRTALVVSVLGLLWLSSLAWAENDCADIGPEGYADKGDWMNARVECRYVNIQQGLEELVEEASNGPWLSEQQKAHLMNEVARAENEITKTAAAGGFKGLMKRQDAICQMMEYPADNPDHSNRLIDDDDICEPEQQEDCAEVIGDGIGDEDGVCRPFRGKKKEVCVQICDDDALASVDENFDETTFADTEANLETIDNMLAETVGLVAEASFAYESYYELSSAGAGECEKVYMPDGLPWPSERPPYYLMQWYLTEDNVLDWAHAVCDSGAEQSVFGTNAAATCVVLGIGAGVIDTIYEALELLDDTISSMRLDAATKCIEQLDGKLEQALGDIDLLSGNTSDLDGKITLLSERVEEQFEEVIRLLCTPHGQRPVWPPTSQAPEE